MVYNEPVFRPPSEAYSLILQATLGCSYNKCVFCGMYKTKKFKVRDFSEFKDDVLECARDYPEVKRIFLADGDAMIMDVPDLVKILRLLYAKFPALERVSIYVSPQSLKDKNVGDLKYLKEEGLGICYYGIESGDDEVLAAIKKGADSKTISMLGRKMVDAGLEVSVTVILGLGGRNLSRQHAENTGKIINEISPKYSSALTLMLYEYEDIFKRLYKGEWIKQDTFELLEELRIIISQIDTKTIFRSNHASNYLAIKANMPEQKQQILQNIDQILKTKDTSKLRPEFLRGL